ISEGFEERTGGKQPYDSRLDVAEALLTGLDCVLIAGTGADKTMPFMMPLLARRFRALGLTAVAVNGTTYDADLRKELKAREYQLNLNLPEMCLQHSGFRETRDWT
ncbi:hypothetical protein HD554DRAFT_2021831, partial [Boletus coccyginus]